MTDLLMDIGNSRIKWGLGRDGAVTATRALPRDALVATDFAAVFDELTDPVERAFVCNVAGHRVLDVLNSACTRADIELIALSPAAEAHGVRIAYADTAALGVDRWVALVAAHAAFPGRCKLVVDAGTACTIDAVNADGRHVGGMILPGLALMRRSLTERTSDIVVDADELADPIDDEAFFATDTSHAVQNGALAALLGATGFSRSALPGDVLTVLTGGDAPAILAHMPAGTEHRPALVLEGLAVIAVTEPRE